jgi:hypothetical protein
MRDMWASPSDRDYQGDNSFYTEALPCESCGQPTELPRVWNPEHELWIAEDCGCTAPDVPLPACMIAVLEAATTVGQLCESVRSHRQSCPVCSGVLEMPRKPEPVEHKEAA